MKKDDGISKLTKKIIYGLDQGLFDDDLGQAVVNLWQLGLCDPKVKRTIEHRVHRHQFKQAMRRLPFAQPQLSKGDLILGLDIVDAAMQLPIPVQYLVGHSLTVANTGAGKTTKSRLESMFSSPCSAWKRRSPEVPHDRSHAAIPGPVPSQAGSALLYRRIDHWERLGGAAGCR